MWARALNVKPRDPHSSRIDAKSVTFKTGAPISGESAALALGGVEPCSPSALVLVQRRPSALSLGGGDFTSASSREVRPHAHDWSLKWASFAPGR